MIYCRIGLYGSYYCVWKWNRTLISSYLFQIPLVQFTLKSPTKMETPAISISTAMRITVRRLSFWILLTSVTGIKQACFFYFLTVSLSFRLWQSLLVWRRLRRSSRETPTGRSTSGTNSEGREMGRRRQGLPFHRPEPNPALGIHLPTYSTMPFITSSLWFQNNGLVFK